MRLAEGLFSLCGLYETQLKDAFKQPVFCQRQGKTAFGSMPCCLEILQPVVVNRGRMLRSAGCFLPEAR